MSQLRQRKHNANNDDIENPPDLISTSWDISFDNESRDSDDGSNYKETTNRVSVSEESSSYNKLDAVLETYYTFSGSTYYAEQGLRTLQYSSWAISYATQSTNSVLSAALEKIYYEIGMARYVLRFYGFLQSLAGFRSGSWAGGSWDNPLILEIYLSWKYDGVLSTRAFRICRVTSTRVDDICECKLLFSTELLLLDSVHHW